MLKCDQCDQWELFLDLKDIYIAMKVVVVTKIKFSLSGIIAVGWAHSSHIMILFRVPRPATRGPHRPTGNQSKHFFILLWWSPDRDKPQSRPLILSFNQFYRALKSGSDQLQLLYLSFVWTCHVQDSKDYDYSRRLVGGVGWFAVGMPMS